MDTTPAIRDPASRTRLRGMSPRPRRASLRRLPRCSSARPSQGIDARRARTPASGPASGWTSLLPASGKSVGGPSSRRVRDGPVFNAVRLRKERRCVERSWWPFLLVVLHVFKHAAELPCQGRLPCRLGFHLHPEASLLVLCCERRPRLVERRGDGPEWLRDELLDLPLPVYDERQARALYAPDGEEVLAELVRGDRDEPCQRGAPREVDDLAGLRGFRERKIHVDEGRERVLDLRLREGGGKGPLHGDILVHFSNDVEALNADQLALPVVVCGHDDHVDALRDRS